MNLCNVSLFGSRMMVPFISNVFIPRKFIFNHSFVIFNVLFEVVQYFGRDLGNTAVFSTPAGGTSISLFTIIQEEFF